MPSIKQVIQVIGTTSPFLTNAVQCIFVSKYGNDSNSGLTIDKTKLTVSSAITAASALTPSANNRIEIRILDAGTYSESLLILPEYVDIVGLSATITNAGAHNTIQQGAYTLINVYQLKNDGAGPACLVGANSTGDRHANITKIDVTAGGATGVINFAISNDGEMYLRCTHLDIGTGVGISDASLDGSIEFNVGSIDIYGNNGVGIKVSGASSLVGGRVTHIQPIGGATGTIGLDVDSGTLDVNVHHLFTANAYDVEAGAMLNLFCNRLTGTELNDGTVRLTQAGIPNKTRTQVVVSSATVTPNTATDDLVIVTAQAEAIQFANPSGTAYAGQVIMIRIKDNGTARAITYGSQYRAIGITLPTTTVISKTLYLGMIFNSVDTKWDVIGVNQEA